MPGEDRDSLGSAASLLGAIAATAPPSVALAAGTMLGGCFRIVRRIGMGGMGVVYRAHDTRLRRDVAVKLHARAGAAQGRLLREAVAMARLSHPNVVTAYEVGTHDDGVFIAMELVEGRTAREWLALTRRGWREIVELYLQAGQGLAAMHRAGLVHRDFKPDNVLVGTDGRVRVADLGLVGESGGRASGEAVLSCPSREPLALTLTGGGTILGTPGYAAPEQLSGAGVDGRADVYAFAASLWEALLDLPPRSSAPPAGGRRIPRWLRAALERGLATDPANRPTLAALLAALSPRRRDPRRWAAAGALGVALATAAVAWPRPPAPSCELSAGETALWDAGRAAAVERAFLATGVPYAAAAFTTTGDALARYAGAWRAQRVDACAATRLRGTQSEPMMDLRVACLERRRAAALALVDVLAAADRVAVERSAAAVASLPELGRCADPGYLAAAVEPPPAALAERVGRLRAGVDEATASSLAGQVQPALRRAALLAGEAAGIDHPPVEAEVLRTLGVAQDLAGLPDASEATLERAYFTMPDAASFSTTRLTVRVDPTLVDCAAR